MVQGRTCHEHELGQEPVLLGLVRPRVQPVGHAQEFFRNFPIKSRLHDDTIPKEETPWQRQPQ